MSFFKDSDGREWSLEIAYWQAISMKKQVGFNLSDVLKDFTIATSVVDDPEKFFSIIAILLSEQLAKRGITEEELAGSINDFGVVEGMQRAFIEAVIDFFPPDRSRPLKMALERLRSATEKKASAMMKSAIEELERTDFDALADQLLSTSSSSAAGAVVTAESTIESSPSGNS